MTGTQCSQDSFWAMSNAELAASTTDLLLTLEKLSQIIRFDHSAQTWVVAFLYSPGCEMNTRHQSNADAFLHTGEYFCGTCLVKCLQVLFCKKKKKCTHSILS